METRWEKREMENENMRAMSVSRRPDVSCIVVIIQALRKAAAARRVFLVCARELKQAVQAEVVRVAAVQAQRGVCERRFRLRQRARHEVEAEELEAATAVRRLDEHERAVGLRGGRAGAGAEHVSESQLVRLDVDVRALACGAPETRCSVEHRRLRRLQVRGGGRRRR